MIISFFGLNIGGFYSILENYTEEYLDTFITEKDVEKIKNWGFNTIRLMFIYSFLKADEPYGVISESRLFRIDEFIKWTNKNNLKLILTLHNIPGNIYNLNSLDTKDLWNRNSKNRKLFLKIWETLTKRQKNIKNLYYEILNEPIAPKDELWYDLANDTIKTIRKYDNNRPILIQSNLWGNTRTFENFKSLSDENIIYTFHFYEPCLLTFQQSEWFPTYKYLKELVKYPGFIEQENYIKEEIKKSDPSLNIFFKDAPKNWNKDVFDSLLHPVLEFRRKNNVKIMCTGFGCTSRADPESRRTWLADVLSLFLKYEIPFTYWNYKNFEYGLIDNTDEFKNNPNYKDSDGLDIGMLKILQKYIKSSKNQI